MILAKDQPIGRRQRRLVGRQMLQPPEMRRAPVGTVSNDQPTAREKLQDVVPGLEDLTLKRLATPHDIAYALFRFTGNSHGGQLAGAIQPRQITRVAFVVLVVFARHTRALRNERRCKHVARVAPRSACPMDNVPRATRFVARAQLTLARQAVEESFQLRQVVGQPLDARRRLRRTRQDGHGDGLLVHVHPEIDD
jgi:hypothetical protein